jgi:mono/diheme cytochrome c family protein
MNDRMRKPLTPGLSPRSTGARGAKPVLVIALLIGGVTGCGEMGNFEPRFRLNSQAMNPDMFRVTGDEEGEPEKKEKEENAAGRQAIADALQAMFGTPDLPFVFRESGLDLKKIRMASGPVGGRPAKEQQAFLTKLKQAQTKAQAGQPELDAEVKKREADIQASLTKFAADKGLADVKSPADLKEHEAKFREDFKAQFEAKAAADAKLAETTGELADLDLQIKSFGVAQKGLYRQHCAHCHGTTGDGYGPTASFLTPFPRDYRRGIYKFKSTSGDKRPTDADLRRTIVEGINDTAMPSFALLPPDEIDALVEYVKYLSFRGETESFLKDRVYGDRKPLKPSRTELVKYGLQPVVDAWKIAADTASVVVPVEGYKPPADRTAWLKAGADLFAGDKAKCFSCHGVTGLGDGRKVSEPLYDVWNKDKAKTISDLAGAKARLADPNLKDEDEDRIKAEVERLTAIRDSYDLRLQAQHPRNLRLGKYRFGRRPLDIYRKVFSGINGTEMPGGGGKEGQKATLTETEIWQLVDYVLSLPYDDPTHAPAVKSEHHVTHGETKNEHPAGG